MGIQKKDIDIQQGIIKVMGEGQKERFVKIGLSTRVAINAYLLRRSDDLPALLSFLICVRVWKKERLVK